MIKTQSHIRRHKIFKAISRSPLKCHFLIITPKKDPIKICTIMSVLLVTGYHYFQAPRPHLCFVFLSFLYFCCDDQSSHARPGMRRSAKLSPFWLHSSDSLELSLIKSEISQSEECLRSWELGPADNLPGI